MNDLVSYLGESSSSTLSCSHKSMEEELGINQGSHSDWKSGKNWKSEITFSSQGKIMEFYNFEKNQGVY